MNERKIGIIIGYINMVLQAIINFMYVPLLIYYIGKSEYGLYQLIGSIIAYFSIMDFGLSASIVRFYSKYKALKDKIKIENLLFIALIGYFFIAILMFSIGLIIYNNIENIFNNSMSLNELETAKNIFILLLINILVTMSTMIFRAIINANEKYFCLKGLEFIQLILQPLCIICVIKEYPTAFSVALVQTILNILLNLYRVYYCFFSLNVKIKYHYWDNKLFLDFKNLALSVFLVSIVDQIFFKTNQVILGVIYGTDIVAIYAVAATIYVSYMSFSMAISGVYLPYISRIVTQNCKEKDLTDLFVKVGRYQYIILVLIVTGFIILGKNFIIIWAGKYFIEAYYIAVIIMIPFTIDLIQNIGLSILQAKNKYDIRAKVYILMGIINIILSIYLGKKYGAIGCASATALSMFIGNGIIMNYYYYCIGIDIIYFWKNILYITMYVLPYAIISNIIISKFGNNIELFVFDIIIYILLYIILLYIFILSKKEKDKIKLLLKIKRGC